MCDSDGNSYWWVHHVIYLQWLNTIYLPLKSVFRLKCALHLAHSTQPNWLIPLDLEGSCGLRRSHFRFIIEFMPFG